MGHAVGVRIVPRCGAHRFNPHAWFQTIFIVLKQILIGIKMANTYTQIYMHVIFAVKGRMAMIKPVYADSLYNYICGACLNRKHYVLAINGMPDHVHMLVRMHPAESVSELVRSLKVETSKWMHSRGVRDFAWQNGFAAFSYSKTFLPQVERYIANQKEHHRGRSFREELEAIFRQAGVEYDERYLMEGYDEDVESS